jgi:hypothetical protein
MKQSNAWPYLEAWIRNRIDSYTSFLAEGNAEDMEVYRESVGRINAFKEVLYGIDDMIERGKKAEENS